MTARAAALRRVIRSTVPAGESVSDAELLRRYAREKDEAAFAAVVRRHTPMVLGVCRRVLPTAQDAEDACQAVFLVLARKAGTVAWRSSAAGWLYAVARKVAGNARVAARRRARREAAVATPDHVQPVDRLTGRELLAVLDAELDRLPPRYRDPLVLCFLQGLTRDEAAAQLGMPVATLHTRIDRGRARLAAALARHGITLSAGLLALLATPPATAGRPHLLESLRAAIRGQVPPPVAALADGVAATRFVKRALLGVALAAATAVAGFGLGEPRTTTAGPSPDKSMPAKEAAKAEKEKPGEKAAEAKTRTITGKVLDPEGKPVAGAEIINLPREGALTVVGKSAADGTFQVTVPLKSPGSYVFPRVTGFASDQFLMPATNTPAEVTFRLLEDVPIKGRVVDTQGKPVAGAAVVVRSIQGFDSLDKYLADFQKRPPDGVGPGAKWYMTLFYQERKPTPDSILATTTDKDGRFTITGVGPERVVSLRLTGPGIAVADVEVVTRPGFDATPYNRETLEKLKSPYSDLGYHPMLYPPETAVVAEPEKPFRGVVIDASTGKPRAGVLIEMSDRRDGRRPYLTATTDAAGRYEIHGARKTNTYRVSVKRDPEAGFIGRTVTVRDTPAYEPVTANIPTAKGIILTGRLLDDQTGEPVAGRVCVGVLFDNEAVKSRPEFDSPDCYEDFAYTKADGVYRTVAPPGPVLLMAGVHADAGGPTQFIYEQMKPDPAYPDYFDLGRDIFRSTDRGGALMQDHWCKVLKLKSEEPEVKLDVRFKRASRFEVKVRDPDGKPLAGMIVAGNTARDWASPETFDTDTCAVYELERAKPRLVVFLDPKRKLTGTLTLKGDEKEPVVVTLGPPGRIKGKVVDPAGRPIAGAVVSVYYRHRAVNEIDRHVHGDLRFADRPVETNAAGEFAMDVVIPGEPFWVHGRAKNRFLEPPDRKKRPEYTVRTGEETDLGTITLKEE